MNEIRFGWLVPVVIALSSAAHAQEPPAAERPVEPAARRVELKTVVAYALRNNPALRSAELDVTRSHYDVLAAQGRYPYVFQADAGFTRTVSPRLGAGDTVTSSTSRSYTVGTALRRTFPFGTSAELRLQGERFENDSSGLPGTGSGDGYGMTGRASVTQPLLRGAGRTVGEVDLRAARATRVATEKARTRATSELVRDVALAYWELWYADEAIGIETAALKLAQRQQSEAQQQVNAGALAPADVLTFSTRVAELEESLVSADVQKRQRSLELGRLMGTSHETDESYVASNDPPARGAASSRAQVEAALRSGSIELAELEAQVKVARTRAEVAGESSRPRLDLEGFVETNGVSERVPPAIERAARMRWTTAHIGLIFELPLDDSRKDAERASAVLGVRIAEQNVKAARDRIAADAALLLTSESAAVRRVALAERTLSVAEKTYEAERARFELGESIPIQVQQAEEEVRRARLRVARARVDLAQTQIQVLHLSGQLLGRYGVAASG